MQNSKRNFPCPSPPIVATIYNSIFSHPSNCHDYHHVRFHMVLHRGVVQNRFLCKYSSPDLHTRNPSDMSKYSFSVHHHQFLNIDQQFPHHCAAILCNDNKYRMTANKYLERVFPPRQVNHSFADDVRDMEFIQQHIHFQGYHRWQNRGTTTWTIKTTFVQCWSFATRTTI